MFSIEFLVKSVENSDPAKCPRGLDSHFVKLNDHWGIKAYRTQWEADVSLSKQYRLSVLGLAPKPLLRFDSPTWFCYVSELADMSAKEYEQQQYDNYDYDRSWFISEFKKAIYQFSEDCEEIYKIPMWDIHIGNFGFLRGQIVCVDMGCL